MESDDVIVEEVLEERGMKRPETKHDDAVWVRGIEKQVTEVKDERRARLRTGGDLVETRPFEGHVKYILAAALAVYLLGVAIAPSLPCCAVGGDCLSVPRHIMWQTAYTTMMGTHDDATFSNLISSFHINGNTINSNTFDMWDHTTSCFADLSLVSHCRDPFNFDYWYFGISTSLVLDALSVAIMSLCCGYILIRSVIVLPLFTPFLFFGVGCCGALFVLSPVTVYLQLCQYSGSPVAPFSVFSWLLWGKRILQAIVLLLISQSPNSVTGSNMGLYSSLLSTPLPLLFIFLFSSTSPITHGLYAISLLSCWVALPFMCSEMVITSRQKALTKEDIASRYMS